MSALYDEANIYDLGSLVLKMIQDGIIIIEVNGKQYRDSEISIINVSPGEIWIEARKVIYD